MVLTALLLISAVDAGAAGKSNNGERQGTALSDGDMGNRGYKFVIDGQVALDIPDSCYNIYITDIDKEITEADFVACVPVKNKRFRFETDLNTMKTGRIRAIMPGDNLCSAWIQIYFIPGFTLNLTVHDGYYDMTNRNEYQFMVNSWLNKDALAVLFESMGANVSQSPASKFANLMKTLQTYKDMINNLQSQINQLKTMPINTSSDMVKLLKRIDDINAKMESIIDKYADSIQY